MLFFLLAFDWKSKNLLKKSFKNDLADRKWSIVESKYEYCMTVNIYFLFKLLSEALFMRWPNI